MILPGFEGQAEFTELGEAFAELGVFCQMRGNDAGGELADRVVAVPGYAHANAPEASVAGGYFGFPYVADAGAKAEVGITDDDLGNAAGAVVAGCAHGGDAVDEFDFADGRHLLGAVF